MKEKIRFCEPYVCTFKKTFYISFQYRSKVAIFQLNPYLNIDRFLKSYFQISNHYLRIREIIFFPSKICNFFEGHFTKKVERFSNEQRLEFMYSNKPTMQTLLEYSILANMIFNYLD